MKTVRDVVISLKGKWSVDSGNSDGYFISGDWLYFRHKCKLTLLPHVQGDYFFVNICICSNSQFEAEAKRMGYINGYEWGKEYPTNGKQPDLPDDVLVQIKHDGVKDWLFSAPVKFWDWYNHLKGEVFKITDPRYKPADEAVELAQSINKAEYVSGLQNESSWFENNDFPPSGAYCQFLLTDGSDKWVNCFIIGVDDLGFCVCRADMDYFASMSPASFRPVEPVKTDCQKFIESAIDAAIVDNGVPVSVVPYMNEIFERMFHAGFKSPEQIK